jgi:hypothetical protein
MTAQILYLIGVPLDLAWLKNKKESWIVWKGKPITHPNVINLKDNLEEICSRFPFSDYSIRSTDPMLEKKIISTSERIRFAAQHAFLKRPEAKTNIFLNFLNINKALWGNKLLGHFKNIPGIVCSSGSSLKKLENFKNHALIIAAGSAVNKNITPHLIIAGDPTHLQGEVFSKNSKYEIPLIFTPTLNTNARYFHWGPQLQLTGAKEQKIQSWLEKENGIYSSERWQTYSSTTLAIHFLRLCGASPIYLTGLDLSTEKQNNNTSFTEELFTVKNHTTNWKWILEAQFISEYLKLYPNTTLINTTENGLPIEGIQNKPLIINKQKDISNLLHSLLINTKWNTIKNPMKSLKELKRSLIRLEKYFEGKIKLSLKTEPAYQYLLKESETIFKGMLLKKNISPLEASTLINIELGMLTTQYLNEIYPI